MIIYAIEKSKFTFYKETAEPFPYCKGIVFTL